MGSCPDTDIDPEIEFELGRKSVYLGDLCPNTENTIQSPNYFCQTAFSGRSSS